MPREWVGAEGVSFIGDPEAWIGVDLDGTLSSVDHSIPYCHGVCEDSNGELQLHPIGPPLQPMVQRIKQWLATGRIVKIMTARVSPPIGATEKRQVIAAIQDYTEQHVGERLEVTHCKDSHMTELWDDRAVKVRFNQGEPF